MNEHFGSIRRLGTVKTDHHYVRYSSIKIDEKIIRKVWVPIGLDSALRDALKVSGNTRLVVTRRLGGWILQAITLPDGQSFRRNLKTSIVSTAIAIPIGLILILAGYYEMPNGGRLGEILLALGVAALALGICGLFFVKRMRRLHAKIIFS